MVLASSTAALATARIGEKNPLFARGTAGPDGAQLELHNSADGATFSVELRVVGPAQLLLARDAGAPCIEQSWSMVRGVAIHVARDVLLQAVQWVRRKRGPRVNAALLPASRLPLVLAGSTLVFQGTVAGERVTVELARHGGRWGIADFRALRNAAPGMSATLLISQWAAIAAHLQTAAEAFGQQFNSPVAYAADECPF